LTDAKDRVAAAIARARTDLDQALSDLERLPAFDPGAVTYAAHALNNYLTVTGAAAELLQSALADHPDPQVRNLLDGVQQATRLMSQIATSLMNTASVTGKPKLRFERVDLALLTQRACAYYQRKADEKQIRLSCESQAEQPFVWADRVAVAAVMDNLLSNAVKYSPPGKQVWVTLSAEPGHLSCAVRDEGPGLSAEDQAKLFQKGVRLGAVPTGGEPSTGYGLAVARELVELMGGTVACRSAPGQGATFSFRLPACRREN
jgi:signal transduction histidine kinase